MLNLLTSISEFERDLLRERIKSGLAHARSKGTKSGRAIGPRSVLVECFLAQGLSLSSVAANLGISKTTVMNVKATSGSSYQYFGAPQTRLLVAPSHNFSQFKVTKNWGS